MGETKKQKSKRSFWIELPILVLVAVLVAVVVRTFLIQTFYIPSESMENTLLINDRVLVNKVVYGMRDPLRGEIVVFKPPESWHSGDKDDYIKRVVGVGGDRVVCCDTQGRITVNGTALNEDYLYPNAKPSNEEFDITVPKGRLWVMGDHRNESADSRVHQDFNKGTIALSDVVGRAFVLFWPLNRATALSPPDTFSGVPAPPKG
jgi:signal peptidase I